MQTEDMIVIEELCTQHELKLSFVQSLEDYGILQLVVVDQARYLPRHDLPKLERIMRLHEELHINLEGIDAIHALLGRIENMEEELQILRNRLNFYE